MKRALLLIILLLAVVALAQEKHRRIGEIDFYGYAGLDLEKVRRLCRFAKATISEIQISSRRLIASEQPLRQSILNALK